MVDLCVEKTPCVLKKPYENNLSKLWRDEKKNQFSNSNQPNLNFSHWVDPCLLNRYHFFVNSNWIGP